MTWRIGSLFAGVAGLDLGLHAAGVGETTWFSEYDKDASSVLAARFPDIPNHGDVTAIDWAEVEPVEVLVGGPPCQPASSAGKRLGVADERWMWPEVLRAAGVLRPQYLLMENPSAILGLHGGRPWGAILTALAEIGYVGWWDCLRASDVGAPHRRERVFLFARHTEHGERGGVREGPGEGSCVVERWTSPGAPVERVETADRPVATNTAGTRGRAMGDAVDRHRSTPDGERGAPEPQGRCDIAPDADDLRRQGTIAGPWGDDCGDGHEAPADADEHGQPRQRREPEHNGDPRHDADRRDGERRATWGAYAAAIERWERLTRSAPPPVDGAGRLNAGFSEWMLGFPEGWVTELLPRNPALRCIGNAVQVQVSEVVGRWLLEMAGAHAASA